MKNEERHVWEKPCPVCGEPMVRRRRSVDGSEFYGCSLFPECRGTLPIEMDPARFGYNEGRLGIFEKLIEPLDTVLLKEIVESLSAIIRDREYRARKRPPPQPPKVPVGKPGGPPPPFELKECKDQKPVSEGDVDNVFDVQPDDIDDEIPF
jgi:ssDNA-binding Zn-finger/Zn-ribbon topoisomerase 1